MTDQTPETTHLLVTLSVTDPTTVPIGRIVDAHLNSVTEVYPEPPAEHDPVWVTPRAAQAPTVEAMRLLLQAAEVGLSGAADAGVEREAADAAWALMDALRADLDAASALL